MKMLMLVGLLGLVLLFSAADAFAQYPGIGKRLAEDAMALVGFIEAGNIGSRDPDCKGVKFEAGDISLLVDKEILPVVQLLAKADATSKADQKNIFVDQLKEIPFKKHNGKLITQNVYDQKKIEAINAYGKDKACVALAAMFQTIVQQRRLSLRDISNALAPPR
jgi:hypothetical protein